MSTNQASYTEARGHASNRCQERPFIDLLPFELLERVITLGIVRQDDDAGYGRGRIRQVCMWRRVCRRWKDVIDDCPSLWSTIVLESGTEHIKPQLENSKEAPLHLEIYRDGGVHWDDHVFQLLVDSASRWQSVLLFVYPAEMIRRLGSSPSTLDTLEISVVTIPRDCRFFNFIRPNLRKLDLYYVFIPRNFDPALGLEELLINAAGEYDEAGRERSLSIHKFHHFLQANPNLRYLDWLGPAYSSPSDRDLQSINLPKLETVVMLVPDAVHLFRAEHCAVVRFRGPYPTERPPPRAWTTPSHALKRVERIKISVTSGGLCVTAATGPYMVEVIVDGMYGDSEHLLCPILDDFLNEAEKHSPISARVELELFTDKSPDGDFDLGLEILKLLQTPVWDPISRQARWRIPNLDTISMVDLDLPHHPLRAFIQARSHGNCVQPAIRITGIFIGSSKWDNGRGEDVLNEVMASTGGEIDG